MILRTSDYLRLHAAIGAVLSGRMVVVRKNNQDDVVPQPFSIDADTSLKLAMNLDRLRPISEAYQTSRNNKIKELSISTSTPGQILPGSEEGMRLADYDQELLDAKQQVPLFKVELSKLKLDENASLRAYLEPLFPILKFDEPKDEAA